MEEKTSKRRYKYLEQFYSDARGILHNIFICYGGTPPLSIYILLRSCYYCRQNQVGAFFYGTCMDVQNRSDDIQSWYSIKEYTGPLSRMGLQKTLFFYKPVRSWELYNIVQKLCKLLLDLSSIRMKSKSITNIISTSPPPSSPPPVKQNKKLVLDSELSETEPTLMLSIASL